MIRKDFKSDIEYYFYLYCLELKAADFILDVKYEISTFDLSEELKRDYLQLNKKGVVKTKTEHIFRSSSITADFTIYWNKKAENIFYLNPKVPINCNVKDIPFRLTNEVIDNPTSLIETKAVNESRTSSSISFPLKMKQLYKQSGLYIQKIKPYSYKGMNCLFEKTFTPLSVIKLEVRKKNSKWGNKGESKIKYRTRTLNEYLKLK